jgi:outer membrane lipoprotein-sorting protein
MKHYFVGFFLLCTQAYALAQMDTRTLLNKMYAAIDGAKQYSYEMHSKERFGKKYLEKKMHFRINENPKKIYMKDLESGVELLYAQGWNENKAYINPNGFPWTNVSFSIYNSRVRQDNHHIVTRAGFAFTGQLFRLIEAEIKKQGGDFNKIFSYKGETDWNGRKCYRLYIENKDYQIVNHTVDKAESLEAFALRKGVPEFKVMELNNLGYGASLKVGQSIKIPNSYAKEVILLIDKENFLPIVQMLYDENDLYEKYEYHKLNLRPNFSSTEFTTQCASYGFK